MARLTDERAAKVDKAARFHWEGNPACWDTDARILDLLDRVAALEAERDAAQADCKAMAAALGNAFPMKRVHVSCGTASHVVVFLGVLETPELLAVVRRWRP